MLALGCAASVALPGSAGAAEPKHAPAAAQRAGPTRIITPNGPVDVVASRAEIDYGNQHVLLQNVTITQDAIRVSANHAVGEGTGINFDNNRWVFTGDVHIRSEQRGELTSDTATVEFREGVIQSALAEGRPAEFEQTESATGVLARGHADSIDYEVAANTVRLTEDAWIKYGDNEETAPVLVYDIKAQKLLGAVTAKAGARVHITMLPKKSVKAAAKPAAKRGTEPPAKPQGASAASSAGGSGPDP